MSDFKILAWSDAPAPVCHTGFGVVSRYVLHALYNTYKYEINQIGINYHGQFYNRKDCPWQLSPAKLGDPNDPYGNKMFLQAVYEGDYDYIWIVNDTFVVQNAAKELKKILEQKRVNNQKVPKVIYYYPIDCCLRPDMTAMIELATIPVAYTQFGYDETIKILPQLAGKIPIIYHGTNTDVFFPYNKNICNELKKKYFSLDPSEYLIINVNRNTVRKQLTRTMVCFADFKKIVPNSHLYLHAEPIEKNIDLINCARELNLEINKDIFFPPNYDTLHGYSDETMNHLFNAADMFITTDCGEGWGLSKTEAMATGIPVVVPDNTVEPEIVGNTKGFMYEANELIYIDGSGFRKAGITKDIVDKMVEVYKLGHKYDLPQVVYARKFTENNTWGIVCNQWISLFASLQNIPEVQVDKSIIGDIL